MWPFKWKLLSSTSCDTVYLFLSARAIRWIVYVKFDFLSPEFSSPVTSRCLSNPCPSNQWCEEDGSGSNNFTCIEPAGFYCSFDSGYCQWQNASSSNQNWMRFSEYGSLRHDHTNNSCAGERFSINIVWFSHVQVSLTQLVCIQAKWPIRPKASRGFCSMKWRSSLAFESPETIYTPRWREAKWAGTVSFPRTQHRDFPTRARACSRRAH